jgi:hypothetical protein
MSHFLSSASTAFFSGTDSFQLRTIFLGQATYTDIHANFDGNGVTIVTRKSFGQSNTLMGNADTLVN